MIWIDRATGRLIDEWSHVLQSVDVIFATRLGERLMLRHFGGALQSVLGRRITPALLARATALFALSIATWEPRLRVMKVNLAASADEVRAGTLLFEIVVAYRPRGHLGDLSELPGTRTVGIGSLGGRLTTIGLPS